MALLKRGEVWYFTKRINGQRFRVSTGFADRKSAERRAAEIEVDIRSGIHGWKSTMPSFAEWWAVYRKTYTPQKSARNRDAQIVAHFLPHFGAVPLDEITKSDIVRYLNHRRTQMTGNPGHKRRRPISESTVRRERGLLQAIFERAIEGRLRPPQPVPRHQAWAGQAAHARPDARRGDGAAGRTTPALPAFRPFRARYRLPSGRDPRHRQQTRHRLDARHGARHRQVPQGT